MNHNVRQQLRRYQMVSPGDRVLVALSGGADSMALLVSLRRLAAEIEISLCACHVHHGLRPSADDEADFVEAFCARNGIPFLLKKVDVRAFSAGERISVETAARELRYQALEQAAAVFSAQRIATAHHRDDNTETVLFNLIRGTGLRGLCGIPPVRGRVIRPLLNCSKAEILEYCIRHGIPYVTDESNFQPDSTRNALRLEIIPQLRSINPALDKAVAKAARHLEEDCRILDDLADAFDGYTLSDGRAVIQRHALLTLPRGIVARVLQKIGRSLWGQMPESAHIDGIWSLATSAPASGSISLPAGFTAAVSYDQLVIEAASAAVDTPYNIPLQVGETAFAEIGGGEKLRITLSVQKGSIVYNSITKACFDFNKICDIIPFSICVRSRRKGERYPPYGLQGRTRSIKKMMIDKKIPARIRSRYPVFAVGETVLWLPGFPINNDFQVTQATEQTLIICVDHELGAKMIGGCKG